MDNERPIEKLLRRYAKKRREDAGAPMEMHPATRRLLQGEVTRQFGKAGATKTTSSGWLAALRAKWIYATTVGGAVVIAAVVLLLNNEQPGVHELAKRNAAPANASASKPNTEATKYFAAPPQAAPALEQNGRTPAGTENSSRLTITGKTTLNDEFKKADADVDRNRGLVGGGVGGKREESASTTTESTATFADKELPPAPATGPAEVDSLSSISGDRQSPTGYLAGAPVTQPAPFGASGTGSTRSRTTTFDSGAPSGSRKDLAIATDSPNAPPATAAPSAAFARRYAPIAPAGTAAGERQTGRAQAFADLLTRAKSKTDVSSQPRPPVLLNFEIVHSGNEWQVIDGDGSTYHEEPVAEPVVTADDVAKGAVALKKPAKVAESEAMTNMFYRVVGTNRTLNQPVVFTWNFLASTNAPAPTEFGTVGGSLKSQTINKSLQAPGLFNNSGVVGKAQINSSNEIEIRATPVNE